MAARIEGPDPPKPVWTRKRVLLSMTAAWSEGRRPAFEGRTSSMRSAIDWIALYIPAEHPFFGDATTYLMGACWAASDGEGFRDLCDRRGWRRSTAMRRLKWGLDHIVQGLNDADRMQNNR